MNILFICDEYPPGLNGGIGSITQSLAREMVRQGHQVYVVGLYSHEYGERYYEEDDGVKIWRLRYGFNFFGCSFLYKVQRKIPNVLKSLLYGQRAFDKFVRFIERLIETEKIDIIEQPDWNTFAYDIGISHPVLPSISIPLVIKIHGSHSYFCDELKVTPTEHNVAVDKLMFQRADALTAVSQYTANVNKRLFHISKIIDIQYNSVEIPSIDLSSARLEDLVVFTGTLVEKKGVFSLMKAWNIVHSHHPNVRLMIFGKGAIEPLRNLLDSKSLQSVEFMGHQPKSTLLHYLGKCTLSVFPSYSETFGLSAVESMACACPTIFTKRSCGPEIINNGVDGVLVEPDNIKEIAHEIMLLLNDINLRQRIGMLGKIHVEQSFELKKSVERHIEFYKESIINFRRNE